MAEPIIDGGTPPPEPAVTPEPSGLPSGQVPAETYDGFTLTDEQKAMFKDGKLNGRFSDMQGLIDKLKESEDKYANVMRDNANTETQTQKQIDDAKLNAQTQADSNKAMNDIIPLLVNGEMVITEEIQKMIDDSGLDVRDVRLGAMEARDNAKMAYDVVGGKAEYEAMIAWGRTTFTPAQQQAFNGQLSELAIEGLHARYVKAQEADGYVPRIEGDPVNVGIKPYANRSELYKDKAYVDSPKGKRDTQAVKTYRARLKATPQNVIFGR